MKKILVIGGTQFVGRSIVERLIAEPDFKVILFNRGISNNALFPELRKISGDRNKPEELEKIFNEQWDVVIDCSGYMPDSVKHIVRHIKTGQYIFISTISVYDLDQYEKGVISEEFPLLECDEKQRLDTSMLTYGERKAECEREIMSSDINYSIIRPSIIFGQYDHTDRLYYWYYRIKNQLNFIIPDTEEQISITYMDDLTNSVMRIIETNPPNSVYNGASHLIRLREIIDYLEILLKLKPKSHLIPLNSLSELELRPWVDLPYFLNAFFLLISEEKAVKELNLNFTPMDQALKNTIQYFDTLNRVPGYGLSLSKESSIIDRLS